MAVCYKDIKLDHSYRLDILVEDCLVLELKSVEQLTKIHEAQLLTYMKIARATKGLLINFNVKLLKEGIKRYVL